MKASERCRKKGLNPRLHQKRKQEGKWKTGKDSGCCVREMDRTEGKAEYPRTRAEFCVGA